MAKKRKKIKNLKLLFIILTLVFTILFLLILFFISPINLKSVYYAPFFITLFLSLFFGLKIFIKKYIPVIIIPAFINLFLILRLLGIKDWFIPIIILGLCVSLIYFFTVSEEDGKLPSSNLNNQSQENAGLQTKTQPRTREKN